MIEFYLLPLPVLSKAAFNPLASFSEEPVPQ